MERAKMLNKRHVLAAIGASGLATLLPSRSFAAMGPMISPQAVKSDLALLQDIYENLHPGLYRYNSKAEIKARFAAASQSVRALAALSDVYLRFSKLLASVRCGHSYANFYSQSETVQNTLFAGQNRLPFRFVCLNQQMVVTDPAGVVGLSRGSRIAHINGVSTRTILRTLLPYVRADGHNVGKQTSLLSVDRNDGYQSFDIFYALHFGASQEFALRGLAPNGAPLRLTAPAIDLAARRAMTAGQPVERGAPVWFVTLRPDGIAHLRLPTFGLYNSSWDWKAWLAASFADLADKSVRALIIDIRGNEGGRDDCGPEILGYLTKTPLPAQAGDRCVAYRAIPARLNPVLETWDDRFRDWGDKVVARPDGLYDLLDEAGRSGGDVTPKASYFGGKVVVLTDATNSSATLQFCQMLRTHRLGTIIGGITGGNLRGINAEKFMFARLPATGLEVDVPLVGFYPAGKPVDSGLVPDRIITPTWRDIAAGTDPVLDAALA
jgi:hypothetical protein